MVVYSIGPSMGYVLCTRLTIQIPDQQIGKQDGILFSIVQMGLAVRYSKSVKPNN